jgi:hypothetical protein
MAPEVAGGEDHRGNPVEQAMRTKYAVRSYVENDQRWRASSRTRVVWAHAVVAPHSEFHEDFASPECPQWPIHGERDLAGLAGRLAETTRRLEPTARPPSYDDVELLVDILAGRNFAGRDTDRSAEADERAAESERLTDCQGTILDVTRLLSRRVIGGPSGRTTTSSTVTCSAARAWSAEP